MLVAIDGRSTSPRLSDGKFLEEALARWAEDMDMIVIKGPSVMHYDGGSEPEKWGYTGVAIIAESHLAIHTFPDLDFVQVDLSSYKPFRSQKLVEIVREDLRLEQVEHWIVDRGLYRSLSTASRKGVDAY